MFSLHFKLLQFCQFVEFLSGLLAELTPKLSSFGGDLVLLFRRKECALRIQIIPENQECVLRLLFSRRCRSLGCAMSARMICFDGSGSPGCLEVDSSWR